MKRAATTIAVFAVVLTLAAPLVAQAENGALSVSATVLPRAEVTHLGEDVLIRANTAWTLVAQTPHGPAEWHGEKTSGTLVDIPDDTTGYWMVVDPD